MIPLSVLDLSPIREGGDAREALGHSLELARHVERLGYHRFWLAEHHNMPGVASAATAVAIAHVAQGTSTIRVGAGGIMLPNHAPLVVAEQFGTLEALFPRRIDLGLGRAPGTDQVTSHALRRTLVGDVDRFPQDVAEILSYLDPPTPGQKVVAVPGAGAEIEVWILGSSLFGAQLAAALGLPFAFASHFAPAQILEAIAIYRARFTPSETLERPHVMIGCNVFAAETDEEARLLSTSVMQAFVNLRLGKASPLPPPVKDYEQTLGEAGRATLEHVLSYSAVGSRESVRAKLREIVAKTQADELMVTSQIFDHDARMRSFEIAMEVRP